MVWKWSFLLRWVYLWLESHNMSLPLMIATYMWRSRWLLLKKLTRQHLPSNRWLHSFLFSLVSDNIFSNVNNFLDWRFSESLNTSPFEVDDLSLVDDFIGDFIGDLCALRTSLKDSSTSQFEPKAYLQTHVPCLENSNSTCLSWRVDEVKLIIFKNSHEVDDF